MTTMVRMIYFVILGWMAVSDLRTKTIPIWAPWIMGITGLLFCTAPGLIENPACYAGEEGFLQLFLRFLPGLAALILSLLSRESIGRGDGGILLSLAFWLDAGDLSRIALAAAAFCGIYGMLLCGWSILGGRGIAGIRKRRIPYLPFLCAASVFFQGSI
ncbi:MAG: prepilin peptidase [[Clostridium] aminophilum]|nr:prepilin peptidase [[Clostridium] aminophilum]